VSSVSDVIRYYLALLLLRLMIWRAARFSGSGHR
jgi:hypothetical protein